MSCVRWIRGAGAVALLGCATLTGQNAAELRSEVQGLRATDVAWRKIPWKSCLIDGLREARKTGKPIMLWVFIDRPVDDARC